MDSQVYQAAVSHASECAPRESCGLVVAVGKKERYWPCNNLANGNSFSLDPYDYAQASDAGEIVAVVHSHVNAAPTPSDADRRGCEESGLPWVIVGHPTGAVAHLAPSGWKMPLEGRRYLLGMVDCLTLVQDYFLETHNIVLPDMTRHAGWEARKEDLFRKNFANFGFSVVEDAPRKSDLFLMQTRYPFPHHVGIFLGDGFFLHHCSDRLSCKDRWAGVWKQGTTHILRHKELV